MIKAQITDVKLDEIKKVAIVGVEVIEGKKKYKKAFRVDPTQHINFEAFREKLIMQIAEDKKNEQNTEKNIEELVAHKGILFNIDT